ncbi:hypothetical protein GRJ2_001743000 [Grus japonensis]|uniref:Uncharacterized protein n=1 Tax=Grus japonensis TaxID=30415 RepID=A0ABC9X7S2_GRUJA
MPPLAAWLETCTTTGTERNRISRGWFPGVDGFTKRVGHLQLCCSAEEEEGAQPLLSASPDSAFPTGARNLSPTVPRGCCAAFPARKVSDRGLSRYRIGDFPGLCVWLPSKTEEECPSLLRSPPENITGGRFTS